MAKVQNVSSDTKSAIKRKSAYSLPNNPTDSGYKADDIRKAFWQPVIDITQSAIHEIDRIVDEMNKIVGRFTASYDVIVRVSGNYYHSVNGFIYTLSGSNLTITGYEGTDTSITIPQKVLNGSNTYTVTNIAASAFPSSLGISNVELVHNPTIAAGAFVGEVTFSIPKEYESTYQTALSSFTVNTYNTIENNATNIASLDTNKLTKNTSTNANYRAYVVSPSGASTVKEISSTISEGKIPLYRTNGRLGAGTPTADDDASPKKYVEDRLAEMGAKIAFSIDPSTYVMTFQLQNEAGTALSTGTVDLPLESLILGATYNNGVLTLNIKTADESLENSTINVDISDLIDGLVSTSTFDTAVDRLDGRIDDTNADLTTLSNEVDEKEIYAHYAHLSDESETARGFTKGGNIDRQFKAIALSNGTSLVMSIDNDYKLTVSLKNKAGEVISSGMVDLPLETLVTNGSYSNGVLTLTLQNGNTITINVSSLISGLVPDTRKVNNKALSADITLAKSDVGLGNVDNTSDTDKPVSTAQQTAINLAKQQVEQDLNNKEFVGGSFSSMEAEKARGYIKGGEIDIELKRIKARLTALEI